MLSRHMSVVVGLDCEVLSLLVSIFLLSPLLIELEFSIVIRDLRFLPLFLSVSCHLLHK